MYIINYNLEDGSIDVYIDNRDVHLTETDLCEYEQIIRDYCL